MKQKTSFLTTPTRVPTLAIVGSQKRYPVRRIYCVGGNYPRGDVFAATGPAIIFVKYTDSIVEDGVEINYPQATALLGPEVELVVAIGDTAVDIDETRALSVVFGYAVGNDLTRADLAQIEMDRGGSLDKAKAFDFCAPCGPIHPVSLVGHPSEGAMSLTVDGELRQEGRLEAMVRKPAALIAELSRLYHLQPGDLIYTGTPARHGVVERNQVMVCSIDGLGTLTNRMIEGVPALATRNDHES